MDRETDSEKEKDAREGVRECKSMHVRESKGRG